MIHNPEVAADAARAAPPVAVAGAQVFGVSLPEWVLILTAIYTALQIYILVRRLVTGRESGDVCTHADCPGRQKE